MAESAHAVAVDPRAKLAIADAFDAQFTDEVADRVRCYARKRAEMLRWWRVPDAPEGAELVNDAIQLLLEGTRTWRDGIELYKILCGIIWSRTSDRVRGKRLPVLSMDAPGVANHAAPDDPERMAIIAELAASFGGQLYEAAKAKPDPILVDILDLYAEGETDRATICAELKISVDEYALARQRMQSLIDELPSKLVSAAAEVAGKKKKP